MVSGGEWIDWAGGECPVPPETIVEVKFRDGDETGPYNARLWGVHGKLSNWDHAGEDYDIIAYRIVKP